MGRKTTLMLGFLLTWLPAEAVADQAVTIAAKCGGFADCNFHRVSALLYRSSQPTAQSMREMARRFHIRGVVNLQWYGKSDDEILRGMDIVGIRVPTWGLWPISRSYMQQHVIEALRAIRNLERRGPVLVHCEYGADRTGAVIAMYRVIYQGWSAQRAAAEMEEKQFRATAELRFSDYVRHADVAAIRAALAKP